MPAPRIALAALLTLALGGVGSSAEAARGRVIVNRVALSPQQVKALSAAFSTPVAAGRYWYDKVSGAWGAEGGPMQGALPPGLPIGGRLRLDASGGGTGVVVNGRELHPYDVVRLRRAGVAVQRGHFWLNHRGIGGNAGGPPAFDLSAALGLRRAAPRKKGGVLSTYDKTGLAVY